ncbi:pyridoxamine 5'-phosphate oxidase [Streptomyces sp. SID8354]|nr:pyridoxamine 5'-phosphate oxidase family protein [Streptomyces sp. SID8354]MYT32416.1 pyridoxamine 5'-phosphate oxidase [Streptomyces sp. SID8354]
MPAERPGSDGEHLVQQRLGTTGRADRFYADQVLDHLNVRMQEFVARQEMFFLATADRHGECDATFRAGPTGFVQVLGDRLLAYPEYRGNGVMASVGNLSENPRLGILMIDFTRDRIGLHINGRARVVLDEEMRAYYPGLPVDPVPGRRAQLWVAVEVEEAYIHCSKHIPHLQKVPADERGARAWGSDDFKRKGGDFFGAAAEAAQRQPFRRPRHTDEHLRGGLHEDAPEHRYGAEPAQVPGPRRHARDTVAAELNGEFLDRVEQVLARARPRRAAEDAPEFRGWFDRRDG